jgi:membrane associated rhomboid family serine protease
MRIPPLTLALLWTLAIAFLGQWLLGDMMLVWFALWPWGEFPAGTGSDGLPLTVGFLPWQLLSYGFLHGDLGHLFFNALALYMFGAPLEQIWGQKRYSTFLLVCTAGAGLCQLLFVSFDPFGQGVHPTVGASGAVYGLLMAYALLFPHQRIMLLIPPIPMQARTFVIVFGAIELVLGVSNPLNGRLNIAHFAHLGGLLTGWLLIRYWQGKPPFRRKPRGGPWRVVK